MKTFLIIVLFLVLPLVAHAQDITQTLRGTIYDQSRQIELSRATLVIPNISYKIEF